MLNEPLDQGYQDGLELILTLLFVLTRLWLASYRLDWDHHAKMLPQLVLLTVPMPSILLLALLTLYHLTPLLSLLPNLHLMPLLHRLSTIIPHPRKRNLPRAFFNLPPRPGSPSAIEDVYVIGIRGKVMLLLLAQASLSLGCGWAYLSTSPMPEGIEGGLGEWWQCLLATLAVIPLPATVFSLAIFSQGGITHHSIFRRIFPTSTVLTVGASAVTAGVTSHSSLILLTITSVLTAGILLSSIGGPVARLRGIKRGNIRLSPSPELQSPERVRVMKDGESWLTSPSQASTTDYSAFSYSPSVATPKQKRSRHFDDMPDGSPKSWLTSPSSTPSTIPAWDYSPSISTPEPARTRPASPRSPSPSLPEPAAHVVGQLPRAPVNRLLERAKASHATTAGNTTHTHTTLSGTPGSMQSPGGSIIAGYETDLSRPMPRGFESLTSYPVSPAQLRSLGYSPGTFPHPNFLALGSRISLNTRAGRSGDDIAFIPEERRSISGNGSTWTLESYHSAQEAPMAEFKTPIRSPRTADRRAPPPPPIPTDLPLPPTPTATSHSPTITVWDGKESAEYLLGEREWVEVEGDGDGLDGWSKEGKGVGIVAVITVLLTFGLATPLLVSGLHTYTQALFLVALLIPAPILLVTSYLLRYRPLPTTRERRKKESTRSESTHKSLALVSNSQLSLPLSISPKLTPPNHRRSTEPTARWSHFLETKPSVSNFGHNRPRPHTVFVTDAAQVYGVTSDPTEQDRLAQRTMARRSTDVWLENGHAIQGGSRLSRVGEMLKPVPAMRMLDPYQRPQHRSLTRLQGGIVSMLPNRLSGYSGATETQWDQSDGAVPSSPITIHITSPTKHDVRRSRASVHSDMSMDESGEGSSLPTAQIHHAKRGRMSAGPTLVLGKGKHEEEEGYELDWMTAGVLPNLVPHLKIGSEIKIGPGPKQEPPVDHDDFSPAKGSIIRSHNASASISSFDFSATAGRSHGHSTSIDFTSPSLDNAMQSTPHGNIRNRGQLKHKSSFSLPSIHAADFEDVRRSFDECCRPGLTAQESSDMGVDLPPFPAQLIRRDLSTVSERDESNESSRMRQTLVDMGDAILALFSSPGATMGHGDVSVSSAASNLRRARGLGELAPIIVNSSYIGNFSPDSRRDSSESAERSMQSHEEEMAEEMERVMAMDTPTRTEFVISPPPSSYASSFGARSNSRASHRTTTSEDAPPVPKLDWRYSTPGQSDGQFTDAEDDVPPVPGAAVSDISSPQMSELDQSMQAPGGFTFAHPHPPPIHQLGTKPSYTSLNHGLTSAPSPHPPLAMQTLKSKNSSETMRSDMTGTTGTTDATPHRIWETEGEPFKPSKQELMMIKTLKERRDIARRSVQLDQVAVPAESTKSPVKRSRSAMALRSPEKPLPLQQVSDANANRSPVPIMEMAKSKRVAVLREDRLPKGSTESQGAKSKASTGTTGSKKDRKKGSKLSTGSAITPLRA